MTIGEAIKKARKSKGITQKDLAKKTGLSQCVISWWETNRVTPTVILLMCVADVLEVTLDELVGRKVK